MDESKENDVVLRTFNNEVSYMPLYNYRLSMLANNIVHA